METKDNAIKRWANKLPFGFKEFAKGMSNENRIAIASLLMKKDELRFSEIEDTLNLPKNRLSQHLKVLLKYGIIRRTKSYWTTEEKVFKSKYKLNPIYKNLINTNINQLSRPIIKHSDKLTKTVIPLKEKSEAVLFAPNKEIYVVGYMREEKTNKRIPAVTFSELTDWQVSKTIKGEEKKWQKTIKR